MSRKARKFKRRTQPDLKYGSPKLAKFINTVMMGGKKSLAESIVYNALDKLSKEVSTPPLVAFETVIKNVTPLMEVKSRRVGGSTYQVPVEVRGNRGFSLAIRWIIQNARNGKGDSMTNLLAKELVEAFNGVGGAVRKKEETHKMAESNKAFAHFRW